MVLYGQAGLELRMYLFWFIPLLLAALIGGWAFYRKVMSEGGRGGRTDGRVLVDKPPPGPES
jgi:hypothetical protein